MSREKKNKLSIYLIKKDEKIDKSGVHPNN